MNARSKALRLSLIVLTALCVLWRPAQAEEVSININAKAFGQQTSATTTAGETIGGGLLNGTTVGIFAITGFDLDHDLVFLAGTVTFTTHSGTLTVTGSGELNFVTGVFSFTGPVTGTGTLAGATGSLTFDGLQNLSDGSFVQDITGVITVDLAP
jgi:hypothetical protein